jgi:hypothetical protein
MGFVLCCHLALDYAMDWTHNKGKHTSHTLRNIIRKKKKKITEFRWAMVLIEDNQMLTI